jgi:Protein of unknown function (DUF3073)
MGRGRAKAKQAKVARQLKYSGAGTDLDALRKELLSGSATSADVDGEFDDDELDDDLDYDADDSGDSDDDDDDDDDELGGSYRAGSGR